MEVTSTMFYLVCGTNLVLTMFLLYYFGKFLTWYNRYALQIEEFVRAFCIFLNRAETKDGKTVEEELKEQNNT